MSGKDVTINTTDGPFGGYLASPASAGGAGIVIIQEIFGINTFIRATADRYAAHGYFGREAETAAAIAAWILGRAFPQDVE